LSRAISPGERAFCRPLIFPLNLLCRKENRINPLIGSAGVAGVLYTLCR
jgi:hypothetical protein